MKTFKQFIKEDRDESEAREEFYSKLKKMHPDGVHLYHETPGHVADSIKKKGLTGEYGVFATVGQNSNFVSDKKKTITHFVVPHNHIRSITHDMRYDSHRDLLDEHPDVKGADVSTSFEKIPHHWVKSVREVEEK